MKSHNGDKGWGHTGGFSNTNGGAGGEANHVPSNCPAEAGTCGRGGNGGHIDAPNGKGSQGGKDGCVILPHRSCCSADQSKQSSPQSAGLRRGISRRSPHLLKSTL